MLARRSTLRPNHATVRMDWRYCSFLGMSLPCRSFMCFRSNLRPMDTSMCGHREAKDLLWLRFVMTAQERRVVSKSGQLHVLDAYKFAVIEKFCSRWQILAPAGSFLFPFSRFASRVFYHFLILGLTHFSLRPQFPFSRTSFSVHLFAPRNLFHRNLHRNLRHTAFPPPAAAT